MDCNVCPKAAALLNENNATYPNKINYYNPQHLSVEALEIHYRIHASILKYLELHEGKPIPSSIGKMLKKCLDSSRMYEKAYQEKVAKSEQELLAEKAKEEMSEKAAAASEANKDVVVLSSDTDDDRASTKASSKFFKLMFKRQDRK